MAASRAGRLSIAPLRGGLPAAVLADQSGGADQGLSDRDTFAFDVGHGSGKQTPDALVPTGRQDHGQLPRRPTVELGRSTCARACAPGSTARLRSAPVLVAPVAASRRRSRRGEPRPPSPPPTVGPGRGRATVG